MSERAPGLEPTRSLERWLNPVLFKDLLAFSRSPGSGTTRLVVYALVFALPLLGFAWCVTFVPGPWRFAGRPVLLGVCALLAFFHLSVAVPAATAFALERDRNTLESLVVSPLSPWRLVLGKLLTALSVGLFGKAAMLPALAVAFVLGGADLGFLPRYLLLLLAVDVSLASFALHMGARRREIPSKVGWIRSQTTQTQLVLQGTVGLTVVTSLIPIYTVLFLVPLAFRHGVQVAQVLDTIAPLGALHPLAALVLWGDANVLGVSVPVWLLGVVFHLLLALPLLADSAQAQRSEGSPPGRATRLLALPLLAYVLLLTASIAAQLSGPGRVLVALVVPVVLVLWGASGTSGEHRSPIRVTLGGILTGLWPARAVESAPERSPGFVVLVVALTAPLVLWAGGAGAPAISTVAALGLVGLSLAAVGARLSAKDQAREDEAFVESLRATAEPARETDPEADQPRGRRRVLAWILVLSTVTPLLTGTALSLVNRGSLPALSAFEPILAGLTGVGISLNPFTSLLPVLGDPRLLGSDGPLRWLELLGLSPTVLFVLHLVIYGGALSVAVGTLRKPLDLEETLSGWKAERAKPDEASPADAQAPPADAQAEEPKGE